MLRIMMTILAVLAITVTVLYYDGQAFPFPPASTVQWLYFLPAAGVVFITIVLWIAHSRSRKPSHAESPGIVHGPEKSPGDGDDGIISIRPVIPEMSEDSTHATTPEAEEEHRADESARPASENETRFSSLPDPKDSRVLNVILEGFRASVGAHAVGALRQLSDDGQEFRVLGTAGLDWSMSRGDRFKCPVPLLSKSQNLVVRSVNATDLPARHLDYSFNAGVIKRVAVCRIGATSVVLLIDTVEEFGLMHPRTEDLIALFAQTLNLLFYREDPLRPRHEIIAEEIARARARGQELALALVLLNKAESVSKLGDGLIRQVERSMKSCLKRSSRSHRVEKFGELMYGVFTDGRRPSLEAWHQEVRAAVAEDSVNLEGGVTIGIAVLGEKHTDAIALREDARKALVEGYKRGGRTVIT